MKSVFEMNIDRTGIDVRINGHPFTAESVEHSVFTNGPVACVIEVTLPYGHVIKVERASLCEDSMERVLFKRSRTEEFIPVNQEQLDNLGEFIGITQH